MNKTTILIVEDESIVAADLAGKLGQLGYAVAGTTAMGEEAVELACRLLPQVVLMDIQLKGAMDGIEAAAAIRNRIDVPVIYLTAHSDASTLARAMDSEPFGYILKPFDERELAATIEMALYKHRSDQQLRKAHDQLEHRIRERTQELKELTATLEERVMERTAQLNSANAMLQDSRRAALNMMEDADAARRTAEATSVELRREIAERQRAEEASRQSEERYRPLFNTLLEGFCILEVLFDPDLRPVDYRFLEVNPAFEVQTGLHNVVGKLISELAPENEAYWFEIYGQVALTGKPVRFVNQAKALHRWYDVGAYRVGGPDSRKVAVLFNDISERKKAQELTEAINVHLERQVEQRTRELQETQKQVLHAEKLSAIGKLSASIAHEFNNPLQGIMSILQGIKKRAIMDEEDRELLDAALEESDRMKDLIRSLQDFNRPSSHKKIFLDVHHSLESILLLHKSDFSKKRITVARHYGKSLPQIQAVPDQIKQVILNLLTNAADACPAPGGKITVSTWQEDDRIAMAIKDTGVGIQPGDMEHIFRPFYSTKPAVKGTGLGLSVSYGIVKNHQGEIRVDSQPGEGATFTVLLPIQGSEEAASATDR